MEINGCPVTAWFEVLPLQEAAGEASFEVAPTEHGFREAVETVASWDESGLRFYLRVRDQTFGWDRRIYLGTHFDYARHYHKERFASRKQFNAFGKAMSLLEPDAKRDFVLLRGTSTEFRTLHPDCHLITLDTHGLPTEQGLAEVWQQLHLTELLPVPDRD